MNGGLLAMDVGSSPWQWTSLSGLGLLPVQATRRWDTRPAPFHWSLCSFVLETPSLPRGVHKSLMEGREGARGAQGKGRDRERE